MPLFERGYEKDPAGVALEAQRQAKKDGIDVVLVDTAGRMQDNKPLMEALSKLIDVNRPDLCLFVGEALVGNDAVDQLKKFNQSLADMSSLVISLTPTLTLYFSVGPIHHASSALRSLDTVAYTARSAWRCAPAAHLSMLFVIAIARSAEWRVVRSTQTVPRLIDGVVLTKFDTVDEKVGAALSMVYESGAPIMFVGCGQTYTDIRKLNVKQITSCLLK